MQQKTIIIRDTIYKTIEKVTEAKTGDIDIYKEIIHSQTETYNFIIYIFLGIVALFAGATWLYNKHLAKSEIIKHTDKIFIREKEKLLKDFKKEFENELDTIKANSARLFALACNTNTPEDISNSIYWWCQCIKYYNKSNKGYGVRMSCENAISNLKKTMINKDDSKTFILENFTKHNNTIDSCFFDIYNTIPNELLTEKETLIKLTKELLE